MFRTWISFTFSFSDLPSILKQVTNAHTTNRSTKCLTPPNYSATLFWFYLDSRNTTTLHFYGSDTIWNFLGCWQTSQAKQSHYHQELFTNPTSCSRSHRQGWAADFAPSFATIVHRPAEVLRHSGFTTLHNSDDFRSFFPFWAEYAACKIGFPASRNWLNYEHSAGTSMSTSLHVLKNFWHQVNIRPAACCFDWASVISVTAAEHGVNLVVTSCTRGLPCSCAAGDCSEDTLTAALHTWSVPPWQGRSCHTLPSGCVALPQTTWA